MAVLEFLAGAAGTGIVTSGQLILDDRRTRLLGTGILLGGSLLVAVYKLLLTDLLFRLCVLLTLGALLWSRLLHLLLHLGNLDTGKDRTDTVVHVIDHRIPHLR